MADEIGDDPGLERVLSCGCQVELMDGFLVYRPCSPTCENYRYALAETARQGKPVRPIVDPSAPNVAEVLREFGLEDCG